MPSPPASLKTLIYKGILILILQGPDLSSILIHDPNH